MDNRPRKRVLGGESSIERPARPRLFQSEVRNGPPSRRFTQKWDGLRAAPTSRHRLETGRRKFTMVYRHGIKIRHRRTRAGGSRMGNEEM